MNVLAIIPARGGSKGILRKNIVPVNGKPLVGWNIEAARTAETVTRVVVSTDDEEIGMFAKRFGAEVVWRPAELALDTSSSEAALLHTIEFLNKTEQYCPDLIVFLQATSPLTQADDINACVRLLLSEQADSSFTARHFHHFVWKADVSTHEAEGVNHDKRIRLRRQEREDQFLENGAVYVMRTAGFLKARHRFFGKTVISMMPAERCFEIDEPSDLLHATIMLRKAEQARKHALLPEAVEAIVFDFDGVMTDNRVWVSQNGEESVCCSREDGWKIGQIRARVRLAIMSTERNPVVAARAKKLGIECFQNLENDKLDCLRKWCMQHAINPDHVVYVGNDENDIECLRFVGCGVVPADAHPSAKEVAVVALRQRGGEGAVRELLDMMWPESEQGIQE